MKNTSRWGLPLALALVMGGAAASEGDWVAQIKKSQGVVAIERGTQHYEGAVGVRLKENDVIVTRGEASVGMIFNDNSMLSLGPNTEVVLQRYSYDPTTYLGAFDARVRRGSVVVTTGNIAGQAAGAMRILTPEAELQAGRASSYAVSVEGR